MEFNSLEELQAGQLILIDKPLDWTSFDVVNKIRWKIRKHYKIKKIKVGHAGTLDPKATGLLIICVGKKTKEIETYQAERKTYEGVLKLGATTASYDTEQPEDALFPTDHITDEMIVETAYTFEGIIQQHPPIHSAIKVEGKRLYDLARKGENPQTKSREVEIFTFEITHIDRPFVHFKVVCSKGTYIRSLAHDFGKALNSGAYLTALRRTYSGDFSVENADDGWLG